MQGRRACDPKPITRGLYNRPMDGGYVSGEQKKPTYLVEDYPQEVRNRISLSILYGQCKQQRALRLQATGKKDSFEQFMLRNSAFFK